MTSPIASRSDLDAAKDRLLLPELWRILNLAGEPPTRDRVKFSSPLRPDAHPSCSFYDGCRRMRDWSTGKDYDAVDFLGEALGLRNGEAIRRFLEIANGSPVALDYAPIVRPQPKAKAERPVLSGFAKATRIEAQRIADSRKIDVRAVELAQDLRTLRVGEVCGYQSWILFDESGLCAEGRRLNRKPYPPVIINGKAQLGERKAHTLRGSRKDWPVGILPAKEYHQSVEAFLLVEGGPDYLAALHSFFSPLFRVFARACARDRRAGTDRAFRDMVVGLCLQLLNKAKQELIPMICPLCGNNALRHQISRRMQLIAQRPRPSIRATPEARARAQRAALARWGRAKSQS